MSTVLQNIAQTQQFFGWKAVFQRVASRSAQKLLRLEMNEMLWLEGAALPSAIEANSDFEFRFLTVDELAHFANDLANDLDAAFAARVSSGHDLCFAAIAQQGQLASYSWYALGSIEAEHHLGVAMSLPADVAYMYKAFTHPDFRGRRLYGTIVAMALRSLARRGVTKLITSIEWTNFASLRSCQRLGFQNLGRLSVIGPQQYRISFTPRAARSRGVRFGRSANVQQR
jgi:ribosomal protein S18 acetylase RimI-like enzyme